MHSMIQQRNLEVFCRITGEHPYGGVLCGTAEIYLKISL
jgi:hypothetical protein